MKEREYVFAFPLPSDRVSMEFFPSTDVLAILLLFLWNTFLYWNFYKAKLFCNIRLAAFKLTEKYSKYFRHILRNIVSSKGPTLFLLPVPRNRLDVLLMIVTVPMAVGNLVNDSQLIWQCKFMLRDEGNESSTQT